MSDERDLAHPIELARTLADLIRVLDRQVDLHERELQKLTETTTALRGLAVNAILFSGPIELRAGVMLNGPKTWDAPYGSVLVDDPSSLGPLLVVNDGVEASPAETQAPGRWKIPVGSSRLVPIAGSVLTIAGPEASSGMVYVTVFAAGARPVAS